MSDELRVGRQWAAKACNDLLDADNNLASTMVPTDTVCFHCQQSAEKMLKAFLSALGIPPPRTHILTILGDQIAVTHPSIARVGDDLVILTPYAVAARYPDDPSSTPTLDDAHEARLCAANVMNWIRNERPELLDAGDPVVLRILAINASYEMQ